MDKERLETLIRIPVGIIAWILIEIWGFLTTILIIFSFFYTLISGKKHKKVTELNNKFVMYFYDSLRYIAFTTNQRPFPFNELRKPIEKVSIRKTQEK